MNLSCDDFRAHVSDWLDGELPLDRRPEFEAHRQGCAGCAHLAATLQATLRIVGDERWQPVPEGMSQRLHAALAHGLGEGLVPPGAIPPPRAALPQAQPRRLRFWRGRAPAFVGAGAALAVLLAVGLLRGPVHASTLSGWLMDPHCAALYRGHEGDHSRACLIRCAKEGYGLVDAHGHLLLFDAGGNRAALAALQHSHRADHIWVTVKAKPMGHELQVEQLTLAGDLGDR